jgi:DNA gyrase/topoisomerase IV subunit B
VLRSGADRDGPESVGRRGLHPPIHLQATRDCVAAEVTLQYTEAYTEHVPYPTNGVPTSRGGTHQAGFKVALARVVDDYGRKTGMLKEGEVLLGEHTREGLGRLCKTRAAGGAGAGKPWGARARSLRGLQKGHAVPS